MRYIKRVMISLCGAAVLATGIHFAVVQAGQEHTEEAVQTDDSLADIALKSNTYLVGQPLEEEADGMETKDQGSFDAVAGFGAVSVSVPVAEGAVPAAGELEAEQIEEKQLEAAERRLSEKELQDKQDVLDDFLAVYQELGVVTGVGQDLNIREQPSTESYIIGKAPLHGAMDILEKREDGWYYVESGPVRGYVHSDFVLTGTQAEREAAYYAKDYAQITAEVLNIREEPNTDSEVIATVEKNWRYQILAEEDGWYQISYFDEVGYISAEYAAKIYDLAAARGYTDPLWVAAMEAQMEADRAAAEAAEARAAAEAAAAAQRNSVRSQVVALAKTQLGGPYVLGGTTLGGALDCSGLTSSVLARFGIHVNRTAAGQASNGRAIDASQMQPGDLLFYSNNGGASIGHVAMYIGNGQIIHATNPASGTKIDAWNYKQPVAIRNVID